jgi:hypothetical protein
MDVVFLIDATGSMSGVIKAAHDRAAEVAINLRVESPDVDFQFGCVCYRDPIDSPSDIHEVHPLSPDMDALVNFLSHISATGGGDGPEDWVGGYTLALTKMAWRKGAKTIIHFADAPAHGARYCGQVNHEEESPKLAPLIGNVAKQGIVLSALDIRAGAALSFAECRKVYAAAGGRKFTVEVFQPQPTYGDAMTLSTESSDFAVEGECMDLETDDCLSCASHLHLADGVLRFPPSAGGPAMPHETADRFASLTECACADALDLEYH